MTLASDPTVPVPLPFAAGEEVSNAGAPAAPATLATLAIAREALSALMEADANYSGNNPDKYRSRLRHASREVELIEAELRARGLLGVPEPTELEVLHARIDAAFPNAQSREVVSFEGQRYRRQFYPVAKSNSGKTVKEWGRTWIPLPVQS